MFNLFKPKKLYCVKYMLTRGGWEYQDVVSACDVAHAWNKVRRRNLGAQVCLSIVEIKSGDFKGD